MGSVGDCFDNAMFESFFATLECELLEGVTNTRPLPQAQHRLRKRIDEGGGAIPRVTAVWSAADHGVVAHNAPIDDGGRPDAKLLCRPRCTQPRKRVRGGERY